MLHDDLTILIRSDSIELLANLKPPSAELVMGRQATHKYMLLTRAIMSVPFEALVAEAVVRARAGGYASGVGVTELLVLVLRADVDGDADLATSAKVHLVGDDILAEPVFAFT